jgi:tetratricopeptide (TPR) repeat protein
VAIGQALTAQERTRRLLLVAGTGLLGGSLLLTLSRGGIAAFIAGQLIFILIRMLARTSRREQASRARQLAWLPLGLAASLALGLFVAQDAIIGEFAQGDVKKLDMFFEGLPLVGRFPVFGVGRGAFWVGFPLVSELAARTTFTHAENAVVQLLADYGVIVGALALLSGVLILGRFVLLAPHRTQTAAVIAALVGFGLHNLVDFNMEVPAIAVLVIALVAVIQVRYQRRTQRKPSTELPRNILWAAVLVSLILAAAIGRYAAFKGVDEDERAYRVALDRRDTDAFTSEALQEVLSRHPADWYIPFVVGARHLRHGSGNPLPWLARALEINPSSAAAHFSVGQTLLWADYLDQALLEFRLAARFNPGLAPIAGELLVSRHPSFDKLSKIARSQGDRVLLWGAIARALAKSGQDREAERADRAILAVAPQHPSSLARHARRLKNRGETKEALELARRLSALPKFHAAGTVIISEVYGKDGLPERAVSILEQALTEDRRNPVLLRALAWARERAGDHKGALAAATNLRTTAGTAQSRSSALVLEGELELSAGRIQASLARFRQAAALVPDNALLLQKIADLAADHGDLARELDALRRLVELDSANTVWRSRLRAVEKKAEENARRSR